MLIGEPSPLAHLGKARDASLGRSAAPHCGDGLSSFGFVVSSGCLTVVNSQASESTTRNSPIYSYFKVSINLLLALKYTTVPIVKKVINTVMIRVNAKLNELIAIR